MAADVFKITRKSGDTAEVRLVLTNDLWNTPPKFREELVVECFNQNNKHWWDPFVKAEFLKREPFLI